MRILSNSGLSLAESERPQNSLTVLKTGQRRTIMKSFISSKGKQGKMGMRPLQVIPWSLFERKFQARKMFFGVNLT
jgi:hypothetical protein